MKLAMPVSLSSILSRRRARRQLNRYADFTLMWKLSPMKKSFFSRFFATLESKHQVEIIYCGRTSEFLLMTSERMVIPEEGCTLEQLLNRLRLRHESWAYELDDRYVICEINRKHAMPTDDIEVGAEIAIFSRKSIFEP